jgi:hypothetical protein
MDAATENRRAGNGTAFLAGLQAGTLGALWMLVWLGLSSTLLRHGFWMPENLLAAGFLGRSEIPSDFTAATFTGIALYLLIYSLLGALFAMAVGDRVRPARRALLSILFALAWYYLSFHLIWKSLMPMVYLLQPERPALIAHMIYGAILTRFPTYYFPPSPAAPSPEPTEAEPPEKPLATASHQHSAETPNQVAAPTENSSGNCEVS